MKSIQLAFASDNTAGAHPRILTAMKKANTGYAKPYSEDVWCEESDKVFRKIFGQDIEVCLSINGTGANVLALKSMVKPWHGIICADVAHINTDEAGAPEAGIGAKLLPLATQNGKIKPEDIDKYLPDRKSMHQVTPRVLSITQSTEFGSCYTLDEVKEICYYAHKNNLYVHMDGSRLVNACASQSIGLRAMTKDAGVDVLSFGGTKNGLMFGEAVIFFDRSFAEDYQTMRKQSLQLISKMRFIACQFIEYFKDDLWLENATHANSMAHYLAKELSQIAGITVQDPDVNAVFVKMPKDVMERLMEKYYCYEFAPQTVRLMCSFATQKAEVDKLVQTIKNLL